jgi:hypothetical protein
MTVLRPRLRLDRGSGGEAEPDVPVTQLVPLSAGQRGLWLAQQLSPDVPICEALYIELRGDLDCDLLRRTTIQGGLRTAVTPEHLVPLHDDYTGDGPAPAFAWNDRVTEHHIPVRHERMTGPESLRAIGLARTEHFHSNRTASEPPDPARMGRS